MRIHLYLILILASGAGCTNHQLRRSLISQASTLTEVQYQQVLGNLAMLSGDPFAIPTHVSLRDGSAQVQDLASATVAGDVADVSHLLPGINTTRTVVEQWGVAPVVNDNQLRIIRIAYRRALGFDEHLSNDLANDLAHDICAQISNTDDIDLRTDPAINSHVLAASLSGAFDDIGPRAADKQPAAEPSGPMRSDSDQYLYENYVKHKKAVLSLSSLADALNYVRLNSNDVWIVYENETLSTMDPNVYILATGREENPYVPVNATPIAREGRRQIKKIDADLRGIQPGWFAVGRKSDIPKDACYVGRYRDCYAWVCPDGRSELAEFTLKVLSFSALVKEQSVLTVPGGPRYTPSTGSR